MSRDVNGNYTLPAGNPVAPNTDILATWANSTMSDIGSALTGSLSRSGSGAMLAPLKLVSGSSAHPGMTWDSEQGTGFFRAALNDVQFAMTGYPLVMRMYQGRLSVRDLANTSWNQVVYQTGAFTTTLIQSTAALSLTAVGAITIDSENSLAIKSIGRAYDAIALSATEMLLRYNNASTLSAIQIAVDGMALRYANVGNTLAIGVDTLSVSLYRPNFTSQLYATDAYLSLTYPNGGNTQFLRTTATETALYSPNTTKLISILDNVLTLDSPLGVNRGIALTVFGNVHYFTGAGGTGALTIGATMALYDTAGQARLAFGTDMTMPNLPTAPGALPAGTVYRNGAAPNAALMVV